MKNDPLLTIKDVDTAFKVDGTYYNAITDVSLDLYPDEILAIVGESGCGKSTLATSVIGLHNPNATKVSGSIVYHQRQKQADGTEKIVDRELVGMSADDMDKLRGNDMGMIFQDPLAALNPLMRVGDQIKENLDFHTNMSDEEKQARVLELLDQVGIPNPPRVARQYPHELSGGMRQRIIIAIAVACKPDLIIADEPTTALDVTIQAQILDLLKDIQKEKHAGVILITHDLGVVAETADRVAVMYAGQIVEVGTALQIFTNPKHPYTRSLLRSMPQADSEDDELYVIEGMVPSLKKMPQKGCRFAPRVPWVDASEHEEDPKMHEVEAGHLVRCTCYQNFEFPDEG
ncbi:peptide/nickel transport system ATP-binding protein [Ligilactobacillus sp. WC1T17]|uniref:Peptide/nickel transport system ATP-binding protein n=1 Tax=Ligilactobacillus ruminis TaxID=1623 RepID=A0ABY1ABB1_9LACO|nr:peptide/nickel transport system ATP-binding protein [Ligilactobacillus ruminis]